MTEKNEKKAKPRLPDKEPLEMVLVQKSGQNVPRVIEKKET